MVAHCGKNILYIFVVVVTAATSPVLAQPDPSRPIWFGTKLDPQTVISGAQQLAKSLSNPASPLWQAKGDQRRTYHFTEANADEPYRVCVPGNWDGTSKLPLVMFLHGAGSNESSYLDQNNKQLVTLAAQHGFLLVAPIGAQGAYGNFLRLTAPFGDSAAAAQLMAQVTTASDRTNELSEKDVINVLELMLQEYPIDRGAMFLVGHSMGSGGTWYIGGKYANYWTAIAPMSGPFVQESGYPWDIVCKMPVFITEGIQAPSLNASRKLRDWMKADGCKLKYEEVNADHGGMIPLVLPHVFDFFDSCRITTGAIYTRGVASSGLHITGFSVKYLPRQMLKLTLSPQLRSSKVMVSIVDIAGKIHYNGTISTDTGEVYINGIRLPAGAYRASISADGRRGCVAFVVAT